MTTLSMVLRRKLDNLSDRLAMAGGRLRARAFSLRLGHIGKGCRIDSGVRIRSASRVSLGDEVWLKTGVILDGRSERDLGIVIGDRCIIRAYTYIDSYGGQGIVEIGADTWVGQGVYVGGNAGVKIGEECMISTNSVITSTAHGMISNSNEPFVRQPERLREILIGRNVWIAAGAVVIDGVNVGAGSVVGANSVVTRSVPERVFAAGNPAAVIRNL